MCFYIALVVIIIRNENKHIILKVNVIDLSFLRLFRST